MITAQCMRCSDSSDTVNTYSAYRKLEDTKRTVCKINTSTKSTEVSHVTWLACTAVPEVGRALRLALVTEPIVLALIQHCRIRTSDCVRVIVDERCLLVSR